MTALVYPDSLPCPQRAPFARRESRARSSIPGLRRTRTLWRDRGGSEQVQFLLTFEQVQTWLDWFENDQVQGGAWFAATWRLPSGRDGVYRFIDAPSYPEFIPIVGWRVTATLEVRGRGMAPQSHVGAIATLEGVVAIANAGLGLDHEQIMHSADGGATWAQNTTPVGQVWQAIVSSGTLRVAVSTNGTYQVMTSPVGSTVWTLRLPATTLQWQGITFAAGLFVAVAGTGSGNRAMTSPDGITWTARTTPVSSMGQNPTLQGITHGLGLFVAVSSIVDFDGKCVMTSPDGITWTLRSGAQGSNGFYAVAFNGTDKFVAVGIANNCSYSSNGTSWTAATTPANNEWRSVAFGAGLFVAVARAGTGTRVATSPDGITWTARTAAAARQWSGVTFVESSEGGGYFVAVASDGAIDSVMTSPDGITWTLHNAATAANWVAVCNEPQS